MEIKPLFVLLLNVGTQSAHRTEERMKGFVTYLEKTLGDQYSVVVVPANETKVQVYYPNNNQPDDTQKDEYKDIIKELAKLTSLRNLRIKFEKDED
jgi:hypothetical protein